MKRFTVMSYNYRNGRCLVITSFKAKNTKEARRYAAQNYMQYLTCEEQLVCATDAQYEEHWRSAVEATDRLFDDN